MMNETREVWRSSVPLLLITVLLASASAVFDIGRREWDEAMLPRPWLHPTIKVVANTSGRMCSMRNHPFPCDRKLAIELRNWANLAADLGA